MLLIKIFEWHGVGQEAITYVKMRLAGTEQTGHQFTCAFICNQRDDESVNLQNAFNLLSVNFNDIRSAIIIYFNIIYY